MTWEDLINQLLTIPKERLQEKAIVYDISYNNNRDYRIYPVISLNSENGKEDNDSDISINIYTEDWEYD